MLRRPVSIFKYAYVVCMYIYMCVRVCVCVYPLESRGSFRIGFSFRLLAGTGGQEAHRAVPNEALYGDLRICSLISCTYLLF